MFLFLVCVLLLKRRIIILDEVVIGVDFNMLRIINNVVKYLLNNCIVIMVVYGLIGLEMILYYDWVIVMEDRRIVEMGSLWVLFEWKNCLFLRYLIFI